MMQQARSNVKILSLTWGYIRPMRILHHLDHLTLTCLARYLLGVSLHLHLHLPRMSDHVDVSPIYIYIQYTNNNSSPLSFHHFNFLQQFCFSNYLHYFCLFKYLKYNFHILIIQNIYFFAIFILNSS